MIVLFSSPGDDPGRWRDGLARHLPDLDFRVWPDEVGDPAEIDVALVWAPKRGELARYPNLKGIFSLGAGVDHLLKDPDLPAGVPIVRLVDEGLTQGMVEYVLHGVLHAHREFPLYAALERRREWRTRPTPETAARRVGILGLGHLGRAAAAPLVGLGFAVAGWSRTAKQVDGVEGFHGAGGLQPFLARTDILVCLLPLTPQTAGIIDADAIAALPAGAFVINAARGGHVVDADLIAGLDSGHLAGAILDVFHAEPLPAAHPFWAHPKVVVTPHMASITNTTSAARNVAANMKRLLAGESPDDVVDLGRGY
jgi:glyoxylate/hydroxypyruvate reductase A